MLSEETIEKLVERLVTRLQAGNEYVLREIGKTIKAIGGLNQTKAMQLAQMIKYGGDYDKIINHLNKITGINVKELDKIFNEVAKEDYEFAEQFYKYRNLKYIPFEENTILQNQLKAIKEVAEKEYVNLSNTTMIGFGIRDINDKSKIIFKGLKEEYYDLIDEAVLMVSQGKETFEKTMFRRIKELGESGLRVVYPTTYINKDGEEVNRTMRLDSAIRMNMHQSIRELHNKVQEEIGKEFGADGIEITVHAVPAPDHALLQGKQFSLDEYTKLQNQERALTYDGVIIPANEHRRKISTLNCYHKEFRIILGVSKPSYSNEELIQILMENDKGFEFEGKHYTRYEGTQLQRNIELQVRKLKDYKAIAEESGDDEGVQEARGKIKTLLGKYKQLSEVSGLSPRAERLRKVV